MPGALIALAVVAVVAVWALVPHDLTELLGVAVTVDRGTPTASATAATSPEATPSGWRLSDAQRRLVERLSHPDTFSLVVGVDTATGNTAPVRLEAWNYHTLGTCFTFVDGGFEGVDEAREITGGEYSPLRPETFYGDMTLQQVNEVLGDIPYAGAAPVPEVFSGAQIYVYEQGLVVAIVDGKLAYASTEWALPTEPN